MATISSTGVGSGLDVNSIVTSLMSLEQRPLTLLQQQEAATQTKVSAFGALKSTLASLGDVASTLADPTNWNPLRVDSANTAAASATATSAASAGKHTLKVDALAQPQVLASGAFASSATAVGSGTLTLELGTTAGGVFTPKSGGTPTTIPFDPAKNTLANVRDAINAAKAGVTASIVNGSDGARLVLRGADGADSSVRITASDADGNNTDASGLSALAFDPAAPAGAGQNLKQTQAAQDAQYQLDGIALTSASNTVSGVLDGVTLTLKQTTTDAFNVSVAVETVAVRKNINDFVNAYNSLNKLLQTDLQADPSGTNRGPLQADSSALSILNGVRAMLRGTVSGVSGTNSLAAAGIELQQDGSLKVNDTKLTPLLDSPGQLASLFSQAGTDDARGFGARFKAWSQSLTGDSGVLASRLDGLNSSIKDNQKRQDAMQERLTATEARLRAQYQNLDTQMNSLNAQMAQMKSALGLS